MRCLGALTAALLSSLVLVGPAAAADDQPSAAVGVTVGGPQVVTDPAAETEDPAPDALDPADTTDDGSDIPTADDGTPSVEPPAPDASGQRGEVHVLATHAHTTAPAPAAAPSRAAAATTLPFTGIDAGALLLMGLALLGAGSGLLAVLRQPVQ